MLDIRWEARLWGAPTCKNDDASWVQISKTREYWRTRLKAFAWMAAWSKQFEVGPLSETDFGNQGGWTYVNGCGTALACLKHPEHGPPTNNTGWNLSAVSSPRIQSSPTSGVMMKSVAECRDQEWGDDGRPA
jgi:hypothetical protein